MAIQKLFKKIPKSTVEKAPGPGLLHPFPNQHWSIVRGALPIDRSPWSMDGGLVVGLVRNRILKYKKIKRKHFWLFN